MAKLFANIGDTDQTPHSAASDLDLYCLPVTLLRVSRLQWAKSYVLKPWSITAKKKKKQTGIPTKSKYLWDHHNSVINDLLSIHPHLDCFLAIRILFFLQMI